MADKRGYNGYNASYPVGGYGQVPVRASSGKMSRKDAKKKEARAKRKAYKAMMRERQAYAVENARYRNRIAAIDGRGGIDNRYFSLPEDKKQKKEKDYFFVMRKAVCFVMCLLMLVSVAYFALGFVSGVLPAKYTALFMETEAKAVDEDDAENPDGEETEGEEETADNADEEGDGEETADPDADGEGEGDEEDEEVDTGVYYSPLDPIFGFVKFVGNKLNLELDFGESPLYDSMIAKVEVGMADSIASYAIIAFPVALIVYIITALVMMVKAFIGMCGRRICKCFGLGSIVMIICAAITAVGGLAFTTDVAGTMAFGEITNILLGALTGVGGFTGGFGLLILLVLPVITLLLSMFARKKVPYSIFDTYGE